MFSTSNQTLSRKQIFESILDIAVIAIGVVAIIFNDKLVGTGLVATGVSLLAKEATPQ